MVEIGDVAEARLSPFRGATGGTTALCETVFTTIPGSPAYPGKAKTFRHDGGRHGLSDVGPNGKNSIQGSFRFSA